MHTVVLYVRSNCINFGFLPPIVPVSSPFATMSSKSVSYPTSHICCSRGTICPAWIGISGQYSIERMFFKLNSPLHTYHSDIQMLHLLQNTAIQSCLPFMSLFKCSRLHPLSELELLNIFLAVSFPTFDADGTPIQEQQILKIVHYQNSNTSCFSAQKMSSKDCQAIIQPVLRCFSR